MSDVGLPGASGSSSTPGTPFDVLIEVQELDTALAQLRHRRTFLPERQELTELTRRADDLRATQGGLQEQWATLAEAQRKIEEQIASTSSRQSTVEQRLYEARGIPSRDLEAMGHEVTHLKERRRSLEDEELEIMEQQEPLEPQLKAATDELAQLDQRCAELRQAVQAQEAEIDVELASDTVRRDARAADLPQQLAERYERLRARLNGVGAARLLGDHCDGCHLSLPAMEVERLRKLPPDEIVTCDNCGRILVLPEQLTS